MKKISNIFLAFLTWAAVITQYFLMIENRVESVGETTVRFFSFFTILTNILVATYFTLVALNYKGRINHSIATHTAITLYIFVVGLVYQVLLRHVWQPQGLQMIVDELLHTIIPLAVLLHWFSYRDKSALSYSAMPYWLIYPFCYLLFILIRGYASGFYPYPFVHVLNIGLQRVMINSSLLLVFFAGLSLVFIIISKVTTGRLASTRS